MRFRGPVEATAVVLGAVLLACVFTCPYIVQFTNAGRLDTNDGRWSIWVVSWVAHALTTNPAQLFGPTSSTRTRTRSPFPKATSSKARSARWCGR